MLPVYVARPLFLSSGAPVRFIFVLLVAAAPCAISVTSTVGGVVLNHGCKARMMDLDGDDPISDLADDTLAT